MTARATMVTYADRAGRAAAITLGFSIPISVALDSVLLAFIALAWLAGGSYREKLAAIRDNPVALGALGLFALLALGTAYGVRDAGDGALYLGKYLDLVFLPVFAWLLREPGARHLALRALAVSLALVLLLSYLVNTGLIPKGGFILGDRDNPVVFKQYLTHNILMAFGAFLFAYLAREALSRSARWTWAALAVLSAGNVVLLMQGRTGYVVLGALLLYMGYASRSRRSCLPRPRGRSKSALRPCAARSGTGTREPRPGRPSGFVLSSTATALPLLAIILYLAWAPVASPGPTPTTCAAPASLKRATRTMSICISRCRSAWSGSSRCSPSSTCTGGSRRSSPRPSSTISRAHWC
jgi:hypothetical protein